MPRFSSATRRHLFVLAAYTLLSVALSWPLLPHIATHVPGVPQWAFDEATFIWNIWYFKHALLETLQSPLHSELIWFPLGIDLILYTYNFYHVLAALPLALAVNLPFASNVALLSSTILSGYGTWLLTLSLLTKLEKENGRTPSRDLGAPVSLAAFIAGAVYAFASNRSVYAALGHYDMTTTQWIPFYALALLRSFDLNLSPARRRTWAILGGLFFALTGLAEMISALFLAMFTLIALLVRLREGQPSNAPVAHAAQPNRRLTLSCARTLASSLLLLGLVAFLIWSPALIPILRTFFSADYALEGWGDALMLSTDLLGWFTATVFHPIFGGDVVREMRLVQQRAINPELPGFRDINTVFLGWATLALALVGALTYRPKAKLWTWTALVFGVLTLGPLLQINGRYRFDLDGLETTVPLPFIVLHFIPIVKANRAPNRNSVLLMLGIAVLVGFGLYWLLDQARRRRLTMNASWLRPTVAAALIAAVLFEHLALPFPLTDARIPAVYETIAAEPGEFSILQLPLGWRNSFGVFGPENTLLQYYQSAHGKPILGGNISRAPAFKMQYFERIPYFQALTEIQFGRPVPPETLEAALEQAEDLMYLYDTRYVLLFPPVPERPPYSDTWQDAWDFVKRTLPLEPTPFWAEDGVEAYRVIQPAGGDQFYLNLGEPGTFAYRGEGWDEAEVDAPYGASAVWATGRSSRLFMPLRRVNADAVYRIQVTAHPFTYPDSPPQQVALTINGHRLDAQPLPDGWRTLAWTVPGARLKSGLNRLELTWSYAAAPRKVIPGERMIGATGMELPIDADLKAFADGGFIALFDEEGRQIDASAGRHGVNLTVLDRRSGRVLEKAGFDTTASEAENERLIAFVEQIPEGAPTLVVTYGEATTYLSEEALRVLERIGAALTLDDVRGRHFAVVGVKGAAPGTAAQVIDDVEAFLRVSLNRDRRPLAAAVDSVQISR
ncbi:MAG: hypothetical protein NZ553_12680 [Caldilinea sp.]|nr:hypothetical protein [Caldilinea sp.]MDW8441324.1 interleukin-like EMT inducer domain-containing protein [Caldilineaceae bacterium]